MKIFAFGASSRSGSYNRRLAENAAALWKAAYPDDEIVFANFREFEMPVYDGDLEESAGLPPGARALVAKLLAADALLIATPEYNGGIPGALKNALDWVSRDDADPFHEKPLLLMGTSPGALGAVRGLWHTRVPFEALGAVVYPAMFGMPKAGDAFGANDRLKDPKMLERVGKVVAEFRGFAARLID